MNRLLVATTVAFVSVVLPASPATAHGGGGSDATNFKSTVTDAVHPELDWKVLAGDALLELRNESGRDVIVKGYQGEPYLRFDAGGGVFENRRSEATYLNKDRYAAVDLPDDLDNKAPPAWARVAAGRTYAWHDHRIHWMSKERPPQVTAAPGNTVQVQRWTVPYTLGGTDGEVRGVLRYVPPGPWWPWVLGAAVLMAAPAVVAVLVRRRALSVRRLTRTGAVLIGLVVLADGVHLWDDLVAVPATVGQNVSAGLYGALFLVGAITAAAVAWRARESTFALVVGTIALLYGYGVSHLGQLSSSQLATVLPEAYTRAVVAANVALAVPVAILVLTGERRFPAPRTADAEAVE